MPPLDHWHPVLPSRQLRKKPVSIKLCSRDIVLFRGADGRVGALNDVCPHRRMRLSKGCVRGDRLVCPYHGWSYDAQGQGQSPLNPNLRPRAVRYDVAERYGAVWVKDAASKAELPVLELEGYHPVCVWHFVVQTPLELLLDNSTEVEHIPTGHQMFGFDLECMKQMEQVLELTPETLKVTMDGRQRPVPPFSGLFMGIHPGDRLVVTGTNYFAPLYIHYDHHWENPATGKERPLRLREYFFFNPVDEQQSSTMLFFFSTRPGTGLLGLNRLRRWLLAAIIHREFKLDQYLIENLADKRVALAGCQLGRFDRILHECRKRLETIYYGIKPSSEAQVLQPNGEEGMR
jgi:vanillate O-demethylase monooxygenase subunit